MRLRGFYGDRARALGAARSLGLTVDGDVAAFVGEEEALQLGECHRHVYAVVWAPRAASASEGVVSAWGGRGLWGFGNSGCPRSPGVRRGFLERVERLASRGCGIVVDALRYPSPVDGELFLSCFCSHCLSAEPSLERVRRALLDAIEKRDPLGFAEALRGLAEARATAVEELALEARDAAKAYGVAFEAAVFPPSLSWLTGQRLDRLSRLYDRLQVMLYHRCSGPACHNREHAALQRLLNRLGLPVQEVLERLGVEPPGDPETLEAEGTPPEALARELREARRQAGDRVVPILWLDDRLPGVLQALSPESLIFFAPG